MWLFALIFILYLTVSATIAWKGYLKDWRLAFSWPIYLIGLIVFVICIVMSIVVESTLDILRLPRTMPLHYLACFTGVVMVVFWDWLPKAWMYLALAVPMMIIHISGRMIRPEEA